MPNQVLAGAGWPLTAMVVLSILVGSARPFPPLARSLALTGLILAVVALVSPIEVRYMLALVPLLSMVGATVFDEADARSFPRQNLSAVFDLRWLRVLGSEAVSLPLALVLLLAAFVHGARVLFEFLPLSGV